MNDVFNEFQSVKLRQGITHPFLNQGQIYQVHIQNNGTTFLADIDSPVATSDLVPCESKTDPYVAAINDNYLTIKQAALKVGVKPQRIRDLLNKNRYPHLIILGIIAIHKDVVEKMRRDRIAFKRQAANNRLIRTQRAKASRLELIAQAKNLGIKTRNLTKDELLTRIRSHSHNEKN